ncbi:MAG: hypothetical protein SGJ17_05390 [Hyphomicrobiales bacterium]|nr:hypothetical protein [Hyphomicrobiales bacterium]
MKKSCIVLAVITGVLLAAPPAWSASPLDKDWPCVQRKIPTLSAGVVWSGPPLEPVITEWRNHPDVAQLVPKLVSRRTSLEDATKLISDYAASAGADKLTLMTMVFAGVFSEINILRSDIIRAIERFTLNQRRRADDIRTTRAELGPLMVKADKTPAEQTRATELEEQLKWQVRIHEDRENSLGYICETPVILEQRAFSIGRDIQNVMN